MWQIILRNRYIFILYLLIFAVSVIYLLLEGKADSHILITNFHSESFDLFFRSLTFLGDGIFMLVMGILFLFFIRIRYGLILISSFIVSSISVQVLKRLAFPGHIRPVLFFREMGIELYSIPGLDYHSHFSFPSGHSTTAFTLFIGFAIFTRNKLLKFIFLLLSCIVAYSRVYLSQHFLEDVLAGSLLGIIVILWMAGIFLKLDKPWMDISLLQSYSEKNVQT